MIPKQITQVGCVVDISYYTKLVIVCIIPCELGAFLV